MRDANRPTWESRYVDHCPFVWDGQNVEGVLCLAGRHQMTNVAQGASEAPLVAFEL